MVENNSPEDVFEMAYEICWRKEILQTIENMAFSDKQEKALLKTRSSLSAVLYDEWLHTPETSIEALGVTIEDFADKQIENSISNEEGKPPMRVYKKYVYSSTDYEDCVEMTAACASENNCDYLIELSDFDNQVMGYLLKGE